MKKPIELIWKFLENAITKLGSMKNVVFLFATIYGGKMAVSLKAEYKHWAMFELGLLILFYASNEVQKWILSRGIGKLPGVVTTTETQPIDNPGGTQ
jgi:hypothetical protein